MCGRLWRALIKVNRDERRPNWLARTDNLYPPARPFSSVRRAFCETQPPHYPIGAVWRDPEMLIGRRGIGWMIVGWLVIVAVLFAALWIVSTLMPGLVLAPATN